MRSFLNLDSLWRALRPRSNVLASARLFAEKKAPNRFGPDISQGTIDKLDLTQTQVLFQSQTLSLSDWKIL